MQTAKSDSKGRVYLKQSLRSKFGHKFVIFEADDGLVLRAVPHDSVADMQRLGRSIVGQNIDEIKPQIRARARKEACGVR